MTTAPDKGWLPFLKTLFGFLALLTLTLFAGAIALGKVQEATSFGGLTTLVGGWSQWAFGGTKSEQSDGSKEN